MEQYAFDLLGSKSDYVCEDKEYEVIYEVEGREIISMEGTPFLSVIMPMYNAECYVREAIESVQKQAFEDFELIIVDDKSTDESKAICEELQSNDSRIKIHTVKENGGAGNARNVGIQMAQGQYITFMDSDDIISPDLYIDAYKMIEQHNVDMVIWGMTEKYYDKNGTCYLVNCLSMQQMICENVDEVKKAVICLEEKTLFGYQCNRFYRAAILKENQIKFEKVVLYEDYFFNLEVVKHVETLAIIENAGYHYMKRQNESITTRFVPEYFDLSKRRIESMFCLYKQWDAVTNKVYQVLAQRYLRYILAGLAKSYDERSNQTFNSRKMWIQSVSEDALYNDVVKNCNMNQLTLRILQFTMNKKMWCFSLVLGKTVWIVKEKMPTIFNRIRKFK